MDLPNVEERTSTKDIVTPLVGAWDQGSNEAADHKHDTHEQGRENVGEREAGGEKELEEKEWEGDEPVDVPDVLQHA